MLAAVLLVCLAAGAARAEWIGTPDVIYASAHTLDDGEVEFGLLAPLQYGISDEWMVGIHPILLLIGVPHLTVRWRMVPPREVTASLDFGATWSFLQAEDPEGRPDDGSCRQEQLGFPGTAQLTGTVSWEVDPHVLLSGGAGFGMDFLDITPIRYLVEVHLSLHWLVTSEDLLMAQASTYLDFDPASARVLRRPTGQLLYAHSFGLLNLGIGVAFGEFPIRIDAFTEWNWPAYPVIDLWWRF